MKKSNICKFPEIRFDTNTISISCFVREADASVMKRSVKLGANRVFLCIDGKGTLVADGSAVSMSKGTLAFCFADETVWVEGGEELTYIYIDFLGVRADSLLSQFAITPLCRSYDRLDGLIPLWSEGLFRASEKTVELVADTNVAGVLVFDEKDGAE